MYGWFIIGGGHMVSMMLYQLVFAGLWGLAVQSDLPSRVSSAGAAFGAR